MGRLDVSLKPLEKKIKWMKASQGFSMKQVNDKKKWIEASQRILQRKKMTSEINVSILGIDKRTGVTSLWLVLTNTSISNFHIEWLLCSLIWIERSQDFYWKDWSTSVQPSGWSTSLSSQAFSLTSIKNEQTHDHTNDEDVTSGGHVRVIALHKSRSSKSCNSFCPLIKFTKFIFYQKKVIPLYTNKVVIPQLLI